MFLRFVFGLIVGSFLNVLSMRYREDEFLFSKRVLGGRSHCPKCDKVLGFWELFPVLSFVLQNGKCRNCGKKISLEYPFVEIFSGFIFLFVPRYSGSLETSILWVFVLEILLLASLIDKRLQMIPDELSIMLGLAGVASIFWSQNLVGPYGMMFGLESPVWLNHLAGLILNIVFLGGVILLTRGKGMGVGDLKLGAALGLILGWPGGLLYMILGFLIGGLAGGILLLFRKKNLKSALPFGPFLALGVLLVFFFGEKMLSFYFETLTSWGIKIFGI